MGGNGWQYRYHQADRGPGWQCGIEGSHIINRESGLKSPAPTTKSIMGHKQQSGFASAEQQLMILLTYVHPREEEAALARELVGKVRDWDGFWELSRFNKTPPLVYENFKKTGAWDQVPAPTQTIFEEEANRIAKKNLERVERSKIFLGQFVEEGIEVSIIKGVAYAELFYFNTGYKRMNDIDILVKKKDRKRIYEIYDELGYFFVGERIKDNLEKNDKLQHVGPAFVSRDMKCVIGTQWGLKTPLGPYKLNYDKVWDRVRDFDFHGLPLKTMSPEDHLHHLCLHLGYFKVSARDLMDLYNLTRYFGKAFDWDLFMEISTESKTENVVFHALSTANRLCPSFGMQEVAARVRPRTKRAWRRGVRKKVRNLEVLLGMCSDQFQTVEKAHFAFESTEKVGEKWRSFGKMWGAILRPPRSEVIKMAALYKPTRLQVFWARLTIPYRLFWVLAQEASWFLLGLLMMKTTIDLFKVTFRAPFVSGKKLTGHREYAESLGVSLEQLQKFTDNFQ